VLAKRTIFIVTERRAASRRVKPILELIKKDKQLEYCLVATGLHLIKNHGYTINEIKNDNFKISYKFKNFIVKKIDDEKNMIFAISETLKKVTKILQNVKPSIVLSGFDIGANFALTVASAHLNLPIAHIQGGERTGSIDESLRHAMSKFSNYHFVANPDAKKRLVRMGEIKKNIFNVGCPSLDALLNEPEVDEKILSKKFKINFNKKFFLVIQHPVTSENSESKDQIMETILAIKKIGIQSLFVLPNNDTGYYQIVKKIKKYKLNWTETLKLNEYKTLLKKSSMLIGNSSSGIHEAASYKIPVVNIGSRQNGRLKAINVINARSDKDDIYNKINFCLNNKMFQKKLTKVKNPYGNGNSAKKII
jgi:UDP-hydrolysing UDP-N-acetyl-D-glucosamine 2-epimerase